MMEDEERRSGGDRREESVGERRVARAERAANRTIWDPRFLFGVILFMLLVSVFQQNVSDRADSARARQQVDQIARQSADTRASLEILKDCTERDDSACARRNQQSTQAAIQSLVRVTVASGLCATISSTEAEYDSCVKEQTKGAAP